ncbi:DUF4190 domain-containing protein [Acrocarpospora sp. B8E8]|uniref:DUF4190 domain-containing protein n=1 Tax=Acrocarpospora sp. B8E8 TaxID=3153572 RepID=UPI00325C8E6E
MSLSGASVVPEATCRHARHTRHPGLLRRPAAALRLSSAHLRPHAAHIRRGHGIHGLRDPRLFAGWCSFGVPCIIAVICGHVGLSETKYGQKGGRGMAVTGLILGYLLVAPMIFLAIGFVGSSIDQ